MMEFKRKTRFEESRDYEVIRSIGMALELSLKAFLRQKSVEIGECWKSPRSFPDSTYRDSKKIRRLAGFVESISNGSR